MLLPGNASLGNEFIRIVLHSPEYRRTNTVGQFLISLNIQHGQIGLVCVLHQHSLPLLGSKVNTMS